MRKKWRIANDLALEEVFIYGEEFGVLRNNAKRY